MSDTTRSPQRSVPVTKMLARRYGPFAVGLAIVVILVQLQPSLSTTSGISGSRAVSFTPALPAGSAGRTIGGIACGPGVRQVPWSRYAPLCEPNWHGNNGGATAPGVTPSTITITYRRSASAELQTIYSVIPKSVLGTDNEAVATLQQYIDEFNKTFELYGRKVKLVPYQGKGDFVTELQGGGQAAAVADAIQAKTLGAFADVSAIDSTEVYDEALAQQKILSFTPYSEPQAVLAANAPYYYSTAATCENEAAGMAAVISRSMAGLPAIYAGDAALRHTTRVFGIVHPDSPDSDTCTAALVADLNAAGVHVAANVGYSESGQVLAQEASTAIARMQASGATTVICAFCDFISPFLLTADATQANYYPEWFATDFSDGITRSLPGKHPEQWSHAIALGYQDQPLRQQEADQVFRMIDPTGRIIPTFPFLYASLLLLFDGLQAAGPDLTPQTFARGLGSLPPSLPGGMFGPWQFSSTAATPVAGFGVVRWSSALRSGLDGRPGAWIACNRGAIYPYANPAARLASHVQPACMP